VARLAELCTARRKADSHCNVTLLQPLVAIRSSFVLPRGDCNETSHSIDSQTNREVVTWN
jgi:hypothetical protein